jgi:hybrid cluster-associated redox disulfide protein
VEVEGYGDVYFFGGGLLRNSGRRGSDMIDKGMAISDVVNRHPETIAVFERHGLGCAGCQAALFENIEQGAEVHGVEVGSLVDDLNKVLGTRV